MPFPSQIDACNNYFQTNQTFCATHHPPLLLIHCSLGQAKTGARYSLNTTSTTIQYPPNLILKQAAPSQTQQSCSKAVGHALELLGSKAQQEEAQHRAQVHATDGRHHSPARAHQRSIAQRN